MCVSGSLISSSTWRSSSVSAPAFPVRSSCPVRPTVADDARQLLPRISHRLQAGFHHPFLQFGGDVRQPLQRHPESPSSCRSAISSNWLRVSTSSETSVIRCSSVPTLTRIQLVGDLVGVGHRRVQFDHGFLLAAAWRQASGRACGGGGRRRDGCRRCHRHDFRRRLPELTLQIVEAARRRTQRAFERLRHPSVPRATGVAAATAACSLCSCTMRSSSSIRSRSLPSGSASVLFELAQHFPRRSIVDRMSETASPVTALPSRNFALSAFRLRARAPPGAAGRGIRKSPYMVDRRGGRCYRESSRCWDPVRTSPADCRRDRGSGEFR